MTESRPPRTMPRLLVAAVVVLAGASMVGCATTTVNTPNTTSAAPPSGSKTAARSVARVGDTLTLRGNENTMEVTVLHVLDPVEGGEYDQPAPGTHFVGVRIKLRNVGNRTYSDYPANGGKLITTSDEQAKTALLSGGECPGMDSVTIAAGDVLKGCLPFEVKDGLRPAKFQFGLDSGFGPQSGEWLLRR